MQKNKLINVAAYILLIVLFLVPRLPGIGSFVTLDEPSWLSQGANFYYALGQREFENTVYEYQPAVTTMWIISAAMFIYFPEYRGFGQGYLDYEKGRLDPFMYSHGYDPLVLLEYARTIQVLVLLVLFLTFFHLLRKFIPLMPALFAVLFVSFDPYYLGLTRMLTHEAMVAIFVLVSLLALAVYVLKERRVQFLLISGVSAGFAQLSKSSSIAMLAGIGVIVLLHIFREHQQGWTKSLWSGVKMFGGWFAFLALTYFMFWPGMWVAPGKMLYQVFGNAFSYAFQGARLTVTEELDVNNFTVNTSYGAIWDVAKVLFYRTTPITWVGVLLSFLFSFGKKVEESAQKSQLFILLLVNTLAFILLIGISQGRNSPHYILSSYVSLNLLSALGWIYGIDLASRGMFAVRSMPFQYAALMLVFLFQMWGSVSFYPYYFTYRNPILHSMGWYADYPQKPYGEALESAAHYLAALPGAKNATALVYYSRGCFSYYYPGRSISFRPYYADGEHAIDLLRNIKDSDYLVVYYANQVQLDKYDAYLAVLSSVEPFHVIWLDGYEYVRIYKVDAFTEDILKALENL